MSLLLMLTLVFTPSFEPTPGLPGAAMVKVGPAQLRVMYPAPNEPKDVKVAAFFLDERPVDNSEFLAFVTAFPSWRKDRIHPVHADSHYLAHWPSPTTFGDDPAIARQAVTGVSWYAAKAFCRAHGKRLPTEVEWELAAAASESAFDARNDAAFQLQILSWYTRSTRLEQTAAGSGNPNRWGIRDLHGLVWEWVYDFNNTMVTGDNRERGSSDKQQFCGAGALAASDGADYASFMRYALRSSLDAGFTTSRLGFRCARTLIPRETTP